MNMANIDLLTGLSCLGRIGEVSCGPCWSRRHGTRRRCPARIGIKILTRTWPTGNCPTRSRGKRERIASMFAANPKLLGAYELKADGYGQSVMLACVFTLGAGGKSLSDVLGRRIRDIYGVDVSVKTAFGPPGYAECLPGPLNPRYLMALRALGKMRSDAGRALEGVDFEL